MKNKDEIERLKAGNEKYVKSSHSMSNTSLYLREKTAAEGQEPVAIVIACSEEILPPSDFAPQPIGPFSDNSARSLSCIP